MAWMHLQALQHSTRAAAAAKSPHHPPTTHPTATKLAQPRCCVCLCCTGARRWTVVGSWSAQTRLQPATMLMTLLRPSCSTSSGGMYPGKNVGSSRVEAGGSLSVCSTALGRPRVESHMFVSTEQHCLHEWRTLTDPKYLRQKSQQIQVNAMLCCIECAVHCSAALTPQRHLSRSLPALITCPQAVPVCQHHYRG
jgi:hypothetical protein